MAENSQQVDHKAEAQKQLECLPEYAREADVPAEQRIGVAQVHASLAIAEGQERVAKELKAIGDVLYRDLEERKGYGKGGA